LLDALNQNEKSVLDKQSKLGTLRPSQILTTFGPGSLYDTLNDSVMIMGTQFWNDLDTSYKKIIDERLLSYVKKINYFRRVDHFRIPSGIGNINNISCKTFPTYGECPKCNKLAKRDGSIGAKGLTCRECRVPTHPARFIIACKNGHIDDFPWFKWIDHKKEDCEEKDSLYLRKGASTVSLAGLKVCCDHCGESQDLGKALSKSGVWFVLKKSCPRRRPWLNDVDPDPCDAKPRGLLKGASNVYFSSTSRALFIPPYTEKISSILREHWNTISEFLEDEVILKTLLKKLFSEFDQDVVLKRITMMRDAINSKNDIDVEKDEWLVLTSREPYNDDDFKTTRIEIPLQYQDVIDNLVLLKRLKETVVLKGFTRIDPADPENPSSKEISHLSSTEPSWLPAVENFGEGIFFSINKDLLNKWENDREVIAKNELIFKERNYLRQTRNLPSIPTGPARFIFLHTLSHLLIRQLAIDAGYSSSSIRERIYGKEDMAGILIYTSSASSDGSLGGLVNLGKTSTFGIVFDRAVKASRWCSSDPLCAHQKPSAIHRDNGSACHACCFLPETSCINLNCLLDRSMIDSTISHSGIGFFEYVET
jgi:hypothetical protein